MKALPGAMPCGGALNCGRGCICEAMGPPTPATGPARPGGGAPAMPGMPRPAARPEPGPAGAA